MKKGIAGLLFLPPALTVVKSFHYIQICDKRDNHIPWILFFSNLGFWIFFWLRAGEKIVVSPTLAMIIGIVLFLVSLWSLFLMDCLPGDHSQDMVFFSWLQYAIGAISLLLFLISWYSGPSLLFISYELQPSFAYHATHFVCMVLMLLLVIKSGKLYRRYSNYS